MSHNQSSVSREDTLERINALSPFLQGPFDLGDGIVISGAWDCRWKWVHFSKVLPNDLSGMCVIDLGCNAGFDCFEFARRGAKRVLGIEKDRRFYDQACFLREYLGRAVEFRQVSYMDFSDEHYAFDIVGFSGVLYHEENPMAALAKVRSLLKKGGLLLLESHVLIKDEYTHHAKFIEGSFWGDSTYWWIFGVECLMGMLRVAGFIEPILVHKGVCSSSNNPADPDYTIEGHFKEGRAIITARG